LVSLLIKYGGDGIARYYYTLSAPQKEEGIVKNFSNFFGFSLVKYAALTAFFSFFPKTGIFSLLDSADIIEAVRFERRENSL